MYDFYKKNFSKKVVCLKSVFVSLSKKFNSVKKNLLCEKIHSLKQTHSAKQNFYFQFSFATNEQV